MTRGKFPLLDLLYISDKNCLLLALSNNSTKFTLRKFISRERTYQIALWYRPRMMHLMDAKHRYLDDWFLSTGDAKTKICSFSAHANYRLHDIASDRQQEYPTSKCFKRSI